VRALTAMQEALIAQRGYLFPWIAVCLGLGIGIYFALPFEPGTAHYAAVVLAGVMLCFLVRPAGAAFGPILLGLSIMLAGFALAGLRGHLVAEPVLGFRYYGPISGRIVDVDRSVSDVPRVTLDRVVLDDMAPARTPARVRVSLHGDQRWFVAAPGSTVMLTGHLSPPNGPVEPGDFDFRRLAWFQGLGAVGYTRSPVLIQSPAPEGSMALILNRLRLTLSQAVRDRIAGDAGGLAAAVMTGDRSGLSVQANDAMRDSNLYHIVSISGTHMGMLVGFVFALIRYGVALVPPLALRVSAKKVAALVALPVAAFYLALAGRDMATERAFVMAAVMLIAILLDRQALTMRSVAIAALIVLLIRPEGLINPGFQMSFAAVVALIFAFQGLRLLPEQRDSPWRWLIPLGVLVFSSLVAGTATAPYAAAHFNRVAHYGLIANLLAMPVMGFLVMPGAVILALLGPLGLEQPALWLIETGCRWILYVAETVASAEGAISAVIAPPAAVLPLLTLGALWVILWQGWARLAGLALPAVALGLWVAQERPALLIADSGALIGVMTAEGRVLSKARGDGFAADNWLENDGSVTSQEEAFARSGLMQADRITRVRLAGASVLQIAGETALAGIADCDGADILIVSVVAPTDRPCEVFDLQRLRQTGSVAGYLRAGKLDLITVADVTGDRLWARPPQRRERAIAAADQ